MQKNSFWLLKEIRPPLGALWDFRRFEISRMDDESLEQDFWEKEISHSRCVLFVCFNDIQSYLSLFPVFYFRM